MSYSASYFEVTAQLIPVLFLAMVVEERLQPDEEETVGSRVGRSWLLALLVVGEILSLAVVAGTLSPSRWVGSLIAALMLMSTFLIALPVIEVEMVKERSRVERLGHAGAGLVVIGSAVGVIFALAF